MGLLSTTPTSLLLCRKGNSIFWEQNSCSSLRGPASQVCLSEDRHSPCCVQRALFNATPSFRRLPMTSNCICKPPADWQVGHKRPYIHRETSRNAKNDLEDFPRRRAWSEGSKPCALCSVRLLADNQIISRCGVIAHSKTGGECMRSAIVHPFRSSSSMTSLLRSELVLSESSKTFTFSSRIRMQGMRRNYSLARHK